MHPNRGPMRRHIFHAMCRVAAPTALCAAVATAQVEVGWQATAVPWRQFVGATVSVYCPPTQAPGGTVWGATVYTDDSSICMAAVHTLTGFDHARGGTVYITIQPGRNAYGGGGDTRGVATRTYGAWDGSFRVVGAYAGLTPAEITDTSAMEVTWFTSARHWRGLDSAQRVVLCPSGREGGLVWGKDVYADSSAICAAAAHAGLIKLAFGGAVTLRMDTGREVYQGVTRNGVRSDSTGKVDGSFLFPKTQIKVARLTQGNDALPTVRERPELIVSFAEIARTPPPPPPPPPAQEPTGEYVLSWSVNARAWRGQPGRVFTMYCPAGGAAGSVWGSGEYTDDSSVCTAAVHALATFDFERGGTVFVTMTAGRDEYPADVRRGVSSTAWASYESSFRVVGGVAGARPTQVDDSTIVEISWATTAQHLRGKTGERRFICPGERQSFPVWGSDVYSDQSSICSAAVHAGVITPTGGPVTIRIEPGRRSYAARSRNGIATQAFGAGQWSFSVRNGSKVAEPVKREASQ